MTALMVALMVCSWSCMGTAMTNLNKCCSKGEQLDETGFRCVSRLDSTASTVRNESLAQIMEDDSVSLYWLPQYILNKTYTDVNIRYGHFEKIRENIVWIVHLDFRYIINFAFNKNSVNASYLLNYVVYEKWPHYCVDLKDGTTSTKIHVLVLSEACLYGRCINKCCPVGMILSARQGEMRCVDSEAVSWSPFGSTLLEAFREITVGRDIRDSLFALCPKGGFTRMEQFGKVETKAFLLNSPIPNYAEAWQVCLDWEAVEGGGVREAVARCALPRGAEFASELARPLCASASVLLLLGALVALGARRVTRCTPHGCALACHALALLVVNVLNAAAWAEDGLHGGGCPSWEFPINLFALVAAFWLNVICCNVAFGFRRAVSSAATAARGAAADGGCGCRRHRYCFCCPCGWCKGCGWCLYGCALPWIIWMSMLILMEYLHAYFSTSDVALTRICDVHEGPTTLPAKLGIFVFFYMPVCILVAVNVASFVYTSCKIRQLSRGGSIIEGREEARALRRQKSALVYIKLLLTTGVLEIAMEIAAWAVQENVYIFRTAATILDLARAAAIFWLCACQRRTRRRFARGVATALALARTHILAIARALAHLRLTLGNLRLRTVRPAEGISMEELDGKNTENPSPIASTRNDVV